MKFRKKPIVVEAMQWDGDAESMDLWLWTLGAHPDYVLIDKSRKGDERVKIATFNGEVQAKLGDYVVRDVAGRFYPCEKSVFEATHEPADFPSELDDHLMYESFLMSCIRGGEDTDMSFDEFRIRSVRDDNAANSA